MNKEELEQFLRLSVPITQALQLGVKSVSAGQIVLTAPFQANINQHSTVFGGSAAMLAVLAAWSLVHTRLHAEKIDCTLVVARTSIDYQAPMRGDFEAQSAFLHADDWANFVQHFAARGKAKIKIVSTLHSGGAQGGQMLAEFAALAK